MTRTGLAVAILLVIAVLSLLFWNDGAPPEAPPSAEDPQAAADAEAADLDSGGAPSAESEEAANRESVETAAAPPLADPTTGTLIVEVVTGDEAEPVPDIGVSIRPPGERAVVYSRLRGRTNEEGRVAFEKLKPGRARVRTNRARMNVANWRVEVVASETVVHRIELKDNLRFDGVVVDQDDAPVANAAIYLAPLAFIHCDAEIVTHSDENGKFLLDGCERFCLLGARAEGYAQAPMRFFRGSADAALEVKLVLGAAAGSVGGTVRDPDGKPIENAIVRVGEGRVDGIVGREDGVPIPSQTFTDQRGRFLALSVEAGEHPVWVRAPGVGMWVGSCAVVANARTNLDVQIEPGATCTGVIRGSDGEPMPRAEVSIGESGSLAHFETYTDKSGLYEFADLPPGQLSIRATRESHGEASGSLDSISGAALRWDAQLAQGLVLTGRIVDADGKPVDGYLRVHTMDRRDRWFGAADANAEGEFVVSNLPEGKKLEVEVRARDYQTRRYLDVDPHAGELVAELSRAAPRTAHVRGVVLDPDGKPVVDATVAAYSETDPDNNGSSSECDKDTGAFEIGPLRADTYRVQVRSERFPTFRVDPRALADNDSWDLGTIRLVKGGRARLELSGAEDEKLAVRIVNRAGDFRGWIDERKEPAESGLLEPGEYLLTTTGPTVSPTATSFSVQPNGTTLVRVELQAGAKKSINILPQFQGHELHDVTVTVRRGSEIVMHGVRPFRGSKPMRIATGFAPGDYVVTVSSGSMRGETAFSVPGTDDAEEITVRLR